LAELVGHRKEKLVLIRAGEWRARAVGDVLRQRSPGFWPGSQRSRRSRFCRRGRVASGLIEKLSSENFEPENYDDEYRNRVMVLLEDKVKGRQITVPPRAPAPARVIDLMAALKESMRTTQRGRKRTEEGKGKKV
jgi:hypothetical protein